MNEVLKNAIETLAKKAAEDAKPAHEAMQLAQAALNLAHTAAALDNMKNK